jgi:hypothetical protein
MPNPALTVGGTPLYPTGGLLDPSRPVYRPNDGSAGLLTQPKMDMIEAKYGFGGPSSDADLYIAQSLSTKPGQATVWGGTLDDPYDPNSDIWKNFTGMLKRLDTTRRDYNGDGGGGGGG